ncbi:MAG: hypothetical protein JSS36_10800 [Proteobacteria bacterium]|nr:hypothetical protein [Pseudomonadota bacterium]
MRLLLTSLAAASLFATPALAGEARVELHTGIGWTDGQGAKATLGGAAGYDLATGGGTFVGIEESVDKQLVDSQRTRWGTSARFGAHMGPNDKLYATAGYNYGKGPHGADIGAGWEHSMGGPLYGKVEYKHYFNEGGAQNSNAALVGVGMRF